MVQNHSKTLFNSTKRIIMMLKLGVCVLIAINNSVVQLPKTIQQ